MVYFLWFTVYITAWFSLLLIRVTCFHTSHVETFGSNTDSFFTLQRHTIVKIDQARILREVSQILLCTTASYDRNRQIRLVVAEKPAEYNGTENTTLAFNLILKLSSNSVSTCSLLITSS